MKSSCTTCEESKFSPTSRNTSWLSSLLVIILPKCPFCVVAYSSAITVCGVPGLSSHNDILIILPLLFASLVPLMIIMNFRDQRTFVALIISLLGLISIGKSVYEPYSIIYWMGALSLLFSVWINSSFLYVFSKFFRNQVKAH